MPMKRETGKDRWRRIPKEYFRSRDTISNLKLQLSALACVVSIAWFAMGFDWSKASESSTDLNGLRANHGELNRVHSAWTNKCDACHVPFEPIDGRPLFSSRASVDQRSSDTLCASCHAGPAHHATMIASEVKSCAQCHRDHQGADFSLVRLKDGECTSCHAQLSDHVTTGVQTRFGNVNSFVSDHPAFKPEAATFTEGKPPVDNSKLKFSHARHMMPGIVKKLGDIPYKVSDIPLVAERSRYQKSASASDPVQLDCASCHVLDSTEIKGSANPAVATTSLPLRSAGKYYLPSTFENSCRACHTLTVLAGTTPLEVPHGVQPDQVIDFVQKSISSQVLSEDPKILEAFVPPIKIPGKAPADATVRKKRDDAVTASLKALFPEEVTATAGAGRSISNANNCAECHYYGPLDPRGFPTKVEPTKVPEIWFTHAAFDHSAHRAVSCRDCHANAYAFEADGKTPLKSASWVATDYLNPGIDNCVQCHAPAKTGGWFASPASSKAGGGVSYDCTECHRYHNGDNKLQGIGASAENAATIRSISQFLIGSGGEAARPDSSKPAKP